jgi:hypothetical protein
VCSYVFISLPSKDCNGNLRHFLWDLVFSCIRINIRKCSRSTSSNTNRRSTTRLRQWYCTGFSVEFFQGDSQRVLIRPFYPHQRRLQRKSTSFSLGSCILDLVFCIVLWDLVLVARLREIWTLRI